MPSWADQLASEFDIKAARSTIAAVNGNEIVILAMNQPEQIWTRRCRGNCQRTRLQSREQVRERKARMDGEFRKTSPD